MIALRLNHICGRDFEFLLNNSKPYHSHYMYIYFRLAICTLLLTLITTVGLTQETRSDLTELSLEELMEVEVVYAASKYEQKVSQAPSAVTIVTDDEIKKYGFRTLADILASVRGIYTTYDRNYHYAGIRGFSRLGDYNTRVLLLVNGIRANDNIYNQASIGTDFLIDVDLIERIEIIRGPSSSLYGTNAFFGVINIITKSGSSLNGAEISGNVASCGTYKGRLSYGNTFQNGFEILLSGSYYDSKGQDLYYQEFDDQATNNGIAKEGDYDQYHSYFLKSSFQNFTLQGGYVYRKKGIPTGAWEIVFNDSRNKSVDEYRFLDLKYKHRYANKTEVMAQIHYDHYFYGGDYVWDWAETGDPSDIVLNKDLATGKWWGVELKLITKMFEKHNFTLGTEYRNNFRQDQSNYDEDPHWQYLDDKRNSKVWAFYAQDEFQIRKNLILNAGVRYDHYHTFGGTTNPRLTLICDPFSKSTVKLLYGKAFRAPNAYELYYNDGEDTQKSNPKLNPEKINTIELTWEQNLGNQFSGIISGFSYEIKDLITLTTDPIDELLVYENVEELKANGLEMELEGKFKNGIRSRVSYVFQKAENQRFGQHLTNSPKHLAKLNMILPIVRDRLFVGLETRYMGERKTLGGSNAEDFLITNLTIFGQKLLSGLEVSASVYNLFDKEYGDPGSEEHLQNIITQDGRNFRLLFTCKL